MTDIVKSNINELDIYKKYIHQRLPPSNIPLVYNNELDVIYDALTEFENMTDNDQEQNTIHDIFTKIYVANKQHSGNSI
jgi:hypothetical protein